MPHFLPIYFNPSRIIFYNWNPGMQVCFYRCLWAVIKVVSFLISIRGPVHVGSLSVVTFHFLSGIRPGIPVAYTLWIRVRVLSPQNEKPIRRNLAQFKSQIRVKEKKNTESKELLQCKQLNTMLLVIFNNIYNILPGVFFLLSFFFFNFRRLV